MSTGTYRVKGSWKTKNLGWEEYMWNTSGEWVRKIPVVLWKKRRLVQEFRYGSGKVIRKWYEYKSRVTTSEERAEDLSQHVIDISSEDSTPVVISPTGDVGGYDPLTSGELGMYKAYTRYLDGVDAYNADLLNKLYDQYELFAIRQGLDETEKVDMIDREYNKLKKDKRSYDMWKLLTGSKGGTFREDLLDPDAVLYEPVSLMEEKQYTDFGDIDLMPNLKGTQSLNDILEGAKLGWEIANSTGLTRIAAMGLAGMPDQLVKSMAVSTQIVGNTERIMGKQDQLTAAIGNIRQGITQTENYKALYEALNEQAKKKGWIKNDWVLRLSRNIPVKERWKRLYFTLAAHIEKVKRR